MADGAFGPDYLAFASAVEIAAVQMANGGPSSALPIGSSISGILKAPNSKVSTVQANRAAHQAAVDKKAAAYQAEGYKVTREVTFKGPDGRRARCDIVCSDPVTGRPVIAEEVKTGNGQLERHQPYVYQSLRDGTAIPTGRNAASAGFVVGVPVGKIEYRGPIPK